MVPKIKPIRWDRSVETPWMCKWLSPAAPVASMVTTAARNARSRVASPSVAPSDPLQRTPVPGIQPIQQVLAQPGVDALREELHPNQLAGDEDQVAIAGDRRRGLPRLADDQRFLLVGHHDQAVGQLLQLAL